jgi:hypothetical protein
MRRFAQPPGLKKISGSMCTRVHVCACSAEVVVGLRIERSLAMLVGLLGILKAHVVCLDADWPAIARQPATHRPPASCRSTPPLPAGERSGDALAHLIREQGVPSRILK